METRMARLPIPPRIAAAQLSTRWLAELNVADSVTEVLGVTRAFIATWSAREILRLPYYCRPGRLNEAKEIEELAFLLDRAQQNVVGRLIDGLVLDRMLAFFAEAAKAIGRITQPDEMMAAARPN